MNIDVAKERILVIKDQFTAKEAESLSWEKKTNAFDTFSKVASFLSRPKDEDFELTYSEHRYEPFWHVVARAKYIYDRSTTYQVPVSSDVVKNVTLLNSNFASQNGHIHLPVMEHCIQEELEEIFVDGVSSAPNKALSSYLDHPSDIVTTTIEQIVPKSSIIVPPQTKVSGIMRDALAKMIKGIQADKILEETVSVATIDLYYHPIYAYKYKWISKGKEGLLEIDGVTGTTSSGSKIFVQYLGKTLDPDFLFDIGADAAGMFVPGGSIAVKAARQYLHKK
jgi:hypothetical protein